MGSCLSQSQNIIVDPSIFVLDGCYIIPTISKRTGEQAFIRIDPKSKRLNIIRETEREIEPPTETNL